MCEVRSAKCEMQNAKRGASLYSSPTVLLSLLLLFTRSPTPARYSPFFQLHWCSSSKLGVFLSSNGTPYSSALQWPGLPCVSSSLADYPSLKLTSLGQFCCCSHIQLGVLLTLKNTPPSSTLPWPAHSTLMQLTKQEK